MGLISFRNRGSSIAHLIRLQDVGASLGRGGAEKCLGRLIQLSQDKNYDSRKASEPHHHLGNKSNP